MTRLAQLKGFIAYAEFLIEAQGYQTFNKGDKLLGLYRDAIKEYAELYKTNLKGEITNG